MELQSMFVSLLLDASSFRAGLDDAANQARGFGGRVQSGLGRVAGIARTAFLGLGAGAVAGFGLAAGAAINMNASLETSTLQFTTLMGDAETATDHVANLFEFAANTPYESQQIVDASLKLQTFGGEALNTMDNLTLVGDAAAAVGAPIDEVSFWVGRLYSNLQAGAPFGEAAARLQELGIMGPQARTTLEEMQASGASANEIFATFQGQLGTFTGAMELQAGTWQGLMSTIKDNVQMAAAEGLKPFFELAKEGLAGLSEWLSSPEVQAGIQQLATNLADVIKRIAEFVQTHVVPFIQQHGPTLLNIVKAVAGGFAAFSIISTVVGWVSGLIGIITSLGGAIAAAGGGLTGLIAILGGPVTLAIAAITGIIILLKAAWDNNWGGIQDKVKAVWDVLQPIFEAVVQWVGEKVTEGIEKLRTFWVETAWPAIQRAIEVVWPIIQQIFQAIWSFITDSIIPAIQLLWRVWTEDVWPAIQKIIEIAWDIIREIFEELGRWINDNIVPWVEFLGQIWTEVVWPGIQDAIQAAWDIILPIWQALQEWLERTIPPIVEALQPLFEAAMSGVSAAVEPVKAIWDGFVGAVQGFWDWLKNKVFNFEINLPDLPSWAVPGSPLPIHTAWADFADAMENDLGPAIANGIGTALGDPWIGQNGMTADEYIERMFGPLERLNSLAGSFGGFFQSQTLGPLKNRIDDFTTSINQMWQQLGLTGDPNTDWFSRLRLMDMVNNVALDPQQRDTARVLLSFLDERSQMTAEYIEQQERLAELEEVRSRFGFVQELLKLRGMMMEAGLEDSIFEGLNFDDVGGIVDAIRYAMQQLMEAAEDELGISSPSQWAIDTIQNLFETMEKTAERESASLQYTLAHALEPALAVSTPSAGGNIFDSSRRATSYGGIHVYTDREATTPLEKLWELK